MFGSAANLSGIQGTTDCDGPISLLRPTPPSIATLAYAVQRDRTSIGIESPSRANIARPMARLGALRARRLIAVGQRSISGMGFDFWFLQRQRSKGSLICTAALELSTNQVTHFYSKRKNTAEMIKMLEMLVAKYRDQDRIYLSWDAASWHASKAFVKRLDEINAQRINPASLAPRVELAPLPSGAQFLNVIESVFSGMARAVQRMSERNR